ncbi:unnamed protein product [Euphydryas editha]|uniref:Uncharacterized protein n=1 Tax=Euphydryas editha TaxID=104508 RepID=A0AAU9UIK1_EUPED|nr:unnamed protein product [Euphydryas editha]
MTKNLRSWFSACGCRGGALATARGSIAALLRSRAFALVSPRAISAYRARPASENGRVGAQYERAAARPGTPLRLAGVFADGSKAKAPKYAQLIDPQGNQNEVKNSFHSKVILSIQNNKIIFMDVVIRVIACLRIMFVHFCSVRAVSSVNRVARTME